MTLGRRPRKFRRSAISAVLFGLVVGTSGTPLGALPPESSEVPIPETTTAAQPKTNPDPAVTPEVAPLLVDLPATSNGLIVWDSDRVGSDLEIWSMKADGTSKRQLTNNTCTDRNAEWSPDGKKIAYESNCSSTGYEIWVMNADGTGQVRLTNNAFYDGEPSWSPDGSRIAFDTDRNTGSDIYWMNADGTGQTKVTLGAATVFDGRADWSRNGRSIAFQSIDMGTSGTGWEIEYVDLVPRTPATQVRITVVSGDPWTNGSPPQQWYTNQDPDWSPDGTKIAFSRKCRECEWFGASWYSIVVVDADGTDMITLTEQEFHDRFPAWSPDGRRLVFETERYVSTSNPYDSDIMVMTSTGTGLTNLTTEDTANDSNPDWGPANDGDQDADGLLDIWEINGLWGWSCYGSTADCPVASLQPLEFVDLPSMGADPAKKDIFVEVDHMKGFDVRPGAIADVVASFGARGINLHVDYGSGAPLTSKPGNWGALSKGTEIPHVAMLGTWAGGSYSWTAFDAIKKDQFGGPRSKIFRYAIFGDTHSANGSSGIARGIPSSDFLVTLGAFPTAGGTSREQAGTFMHELGHTLGLRHGGGDHTHRKPNYRSIMNYLFQLPWIPGNARPILDYSDSALASLNEAHLNETIGVGTPANQNTSRFCGVNEQIVWGSNVVDWNCDGDESDTDVRYNVNGDTVDGTGAAIIGVLTGYNDWTHIVFRGGSVGGSGMVAALPGSTPDLDEITASEAWKQREDLNFTDPSVGLVDPASGRWYLRSPLDDVISFYYGNPGDYPFVGDWDCDGYDTPGLYRQSDGFAYLRNTNSEGVADISFFLGNPGDIPIAGDFDGDGCDTLSVYRPSQGRVYITDTLGQNGGIFVAEYDYYFGNPGDKPFVGDFDGDRVDTIGLHRESSGFVYFRNSHTQGVADSQYYFGIPNDRLVAGDWGDINGVDTVAVFRPSVTTFYFRFTNTQGNADSQFIWGQPAWLPVAGSFGL